MTTRHIIPIVEGDGDMLAVPSLVHAILRDLGSRSVIVRDPKNAHGSSNLTKPGGIERFVKYAWMDPRCDGVLVLLDSDDKCPVTLARALAERIRNVGGVKPTAVVAAAREYECWFLASCESLAGLTVDGAELLPTDLSFPGNPELKRGAKEWLSARLPRGRCYKETEHQLILTRALAHDSAAAKCRSFRRMVSAVSFLSNAITGRVPSNVTP